MILDVDTPLFAREYLAQLSDAQLDLKVIKTLEPDYYSEEPSLYCTKFSDYGPMHPARATMWFGHYYSLAHRAMMNRREDYRKILENSGFAPSNKKMDIFAETDAKLKGFWKARRFCDVEGLKYSTFCYAILDASERFGFKRLAQPQEMLQVKLVTYCAEKLTNKGWVSSDLP